MTAFGLPALALAGCGSSPPAPGPVFMAPRFSPTNPIWLHARVLDIQDTYIPPLKEPNIESQLPITLGDTAVLWARTRLRPTGVGGNTARMTFPRAAVTETPLPRTGGIGGMFTRDQVSRIDTDLIGELTIVDAEGRQVGFAQARVTRGLSIAEGTTLNERNSILNALINDTATTFGRGMENKIETDMTLFVAFPPA
ncbi:MAG: hypothetical protein RIB84_01215 [Sneathiellaceae bacterium]